MADLDALDGNDVEKIPPQKNQQTTNQSKAQAHQTHAKFQQQPGRVGLGSRRTLADLGLDIVHSGTMAVVGRMGEELGAGDARAVVCLLLVVETEI
jgi:hypothetical protein